MSKRRGDVSSVKKEPIKRNRQKCGTGESDDSVMWRIVNVLGKDAVISAYNKAITNAKEGNGKPDFKTFKEKYWPGLKRNRIITRGKTRSGLGRSERKRNGNRNQRLRMRKVPTVKRIYEQYLSLTRSDSPCKIYNGPLQSGYPAISLGNQIQVDAVKRIYPNYEFTKSEDKRVSWKLPLHQVPAYLHSGFEADLGGKSEVVFAHSCHHKDCLVHAQVSIRNANNAQNHCKCYQIVDTNLYRNCHHWPVKCLLPGCQAFTYQQ